MKDRLLRLLHDRGIGDDVVSAVLDSGFYLRDCFDPFSRQRYMSVSDGMYGNKQFSSSFDVDDFVRYLRGENPFDAAPPFNEVTVRTHDELEAVLAEPRRKRHITEGSLCFRGQPREYKIKRRI